MNEKSSIFIVAAPKTKSVRKLLKMGNLVIRNEQKMTDEYCII